MKLNEEQLTEIIIKSKNKEVIHKAYEIFRRIPRSQYLYADIIDDCIVEEIAKEAFNSQIGDYDNDFLKRAKTHSIHKSIREEAKRILGSFKPEKITIEDLEETSKSVIEGEKE